jgi:hypothetical protein
LSVFAALAVEEIILRVRQGYFRRRDILFQVLHFRGAGNRQHHRAALQEPGQRHGAGRDIVRMGDLVERPARRGQVTRRQGKPGNKADGVLFAIFQHRLALPVHQIVVVLHRGGGKHFACRFNFGHRHFAEPGMSNDAIVQQRLDGGELFAGCHLGINAVQLPQRDGLNPQPRPALVRCRHQIFGIAIGLPAVGARAGQPALGGDHQTLVGIKRLAQQIFRNLRPIGIGGVDKIDAKLRQPLQGAQRLGLVLGWTPDAPARHPHSAEAEAMNRNFSADFKDAGFVSAGHGPLLVSPPGHAMIERLFPAGNHDEDFSAPVRHGVFADQPGGARR